MQILYKTDRNFCTEDVRFLVRFHCIIDLIFFHLINDVEAATVCMTNLRRSFEYGGRKEYPSTNELMMMTVSSPTRRRFDVHTTFCECCGRWNDDFCSLTYMDDDNGKWLARHRFDAHTTFCECY